MEKRVTKFGTGAHVVVDKELIGRTVNVEVKDQAATAAIETQEVSDGGQQEESRSNECEEKVE